MEKAYRRRCNTAARSKEEVVLKSQVKELERRGRELERILGKKTLENEILRETVKLAREKTHLVAAIARGGKYRLRQITETLQVSRPNLHLQLKGPSGPKTSSRKGDEELSNLRDRQRKADLWL